MPAFASCLRRHRHPGRILLGVLLTTAIAIPGVTTPGIAAEPPGPRIMSVQSTRTSTTARVAWTLDAPAQGWVKFGLTTRYGAWSARELTFRYSRHVQVIDGLRPGTRYHYRIVSRDRAGTITRSRDLTLTTLGASPSPDPTAVRVPATIDASGSTDVSGELQRFVDRVPDGSTIDFPGDATYRVSRGIRLSGRRNLVFNGHGATLKTTGAGDSIAGSPFFIDGGSRGITLRNLELVGSNDRAGSPGALQAGLEGQMGVAIYGSSDIEIARVTMRRFYADCVYIGAGPGREYSRGIALHDSRCTLTGRSGVSIIAGRDVTIERVRFDQIGMFVVDIEPNESWQGATDVVIRDNSIGSYGLTRRYTSWVLAAEGAEGSIVRDVWLVGNTISGGPAGRDGRALGLNVTVKDNGPRENFVVRDNTATITVAGPVMQFRGVQGVIVKGNRQPLSSGQLATFSGSTSVTVQQ